MASTLSKLKYISPPPKEVIPDETSMTLHKAELGFEVSAVSAPLIAEENPKWENQYYYKIILL